MLYPLSFLLVLFAYDGLSVWLGAAFAGHPTRVLQCLAVAAFANGLAALPFALVQGAGRADITGKLHFLELPFYLTAVWVLTQHFGIEGTAIAWALRVIIDAIV